ncbi:hypothetical protein AYI70_g1449 [Smittium culicis]|uniref:Uncharacterized protein n=1 Tax=Smittium culicis TaxID=133412 RepID=A0A1R1YCK8_9FUNG|nr:hypothetical protein AYI70_g1449 [Smittium culicis]
MKLALSKLPLENIKIASLLINNKTKQIKHYRISAVISFEGLNPHFRGDSKDFDSVEIWNRKFNSIAHLKGWDEKQSIEVFKVWLERPAAEWIYQDKNEKKEYSYNSVK